MPPASSHRRDKRRVSTRHSQRSRDASAAAKPQRSSRHSRRSLATKHRGRKNGEDATWTPVASSDTEETATAETSSDAYTSSSASSDERPASRRVRVIRVVTMTPQLWRSAGSLLRRVTRAATPSLVPQEYRTPRPAAVAAAAAIAESSDSEIDGYASDAPLFYSDDIIEPQGIPPDTPGTWQQGGGRDSKYRLLNDGTLGDERIAYIQTLLSDLRVRREEAAIRKRAREEDGPTAVPCVSSAAAAAAAAVYSDSSTCNSHSDESSTKRPRVPKCVACLDAYSTRVLEPCGHFYTCDACTALSPEVTTCPWCRGKVSSIVVPQFDQH